MAFLDQNPEIGYPAAAAVGLLIGSFLNVVILRLPRRLRQCGPHRPGVLRGEPEQQVVVEEEVRPVVGRGC